MNVSLQIVCLSVRVPVVKDFINCGYGAMQEEVIQKFKALSGDCRLSLLLALLESNRPLCVNELVARLGVSQTRVSRNVHILKYSGLLKADRQGIKVFYDLNRTDRTSLALFDFLATTFQIPYTGEECHYSRGMV